MFILGDICFGAIGQGEVICLKPNCTKRHRRGKVPFEPGDVLVAKSQDAVFREPVLKHKVVDEDAGGRWKFEEKSLKTWMELFLISS